MKIFDWINHWLKIFELFYDYSKVESNRIEYYSVLKTLYSI
jgi:hypothetical protein